MGVDWDGSPANYTCYSPTNPLIPRGTEPLLECDQLADDYQPQHFCMNSPIHYSDNVPTHGDHRPIWPKFGEYRFVPAQRWTQMQTGYKYYGQGVIHTNIYYFQLNENVKLRLDLSPCDHTLHMKMWQIWSHEQHNSGF